MTESNDTLSTSTAADAPPPATTAPPAAGQTGAAQGEARQPDPSIGRIVHYVLPGGDHRPGIITSCEGYGINLVIFRDMHDEPGSNFAAGCRFDPEGKTDLTWHWPERVG